MDKEIKKDIIFDDKKVETAEGLAKTELNDDELDQVTGGVNILDLINTIKDVITK